MSLRYDELALELDSMYQKAFDLERDIDCLEGWDELTQAELDRLFAMKHEYGLVCKAIDRHEKLLEREA